ncbi:gamma-glutamyltransferase [Bradyrhizobium nanningense]|uniref:Glutathione hydrolase proenzyme n=1 Tax=Bradyrhizobium nanningense TaxID=1325118 RepID=A0A4Q0SES8_9BRAD|nr:gamma-glutamyltransferase [Bradyrhizobium nanningense]
MMANWRALAGTTFDCEKTSVTASKGMVVTNHPLASAAAVEMLTMGGNAIDATIAALFTLNVVEPMMVGLFGGGTALIRLTSGQVVALDALSTAPAAARPDSYKPVSDTWPGYMDVEGRSNAVGASSVAVPGALLGWCEALERFGRLDLDTVLQPAIRHATRGFAASEYLCMSARIVASDLAKDPAISAIFLPNGMPLKVGERIRLPELAETLRIIALDGARALHGGDLGRRCAEYLSSKGSFLSVSDLERYKTIEREPVRGDYRGLEIIGPPPPCSGGVHVVQMLNIVEEFDVAKLGFGTSESIHLLAEVIKIAASDRRASTADPDFFDVPLERLSSKAYADERRAEISMESARAHKPIAVGNDSANTTHVTIADADGNVVSSTQTINSLFGARLIIPGTGIIPNNYMYLFDPHPGQPLSLEPGKRITSTQSPLVVLKDGTPRYALGLPGGPRLYPSAFQAVVNLIDHRMTLQEAVEAPRIWTQGQELEVERAFGEDVLADVRAKGHNIAQIAHVAGGMCAIEFNEDGSTTGASCWRADGTPVGIGGGYARSGTVFWADYERREPSANDQSSNQ